jgi:hypothetical protein
VLVQYAVADDSVFFDGEVPIGATVLRPNRRDIVYRIDRRDHGERPGGGLNVWVGLRYRGDWKQFGGGTELVSSPRPVIEETWRVRRPV